MANASVSTLRVKGALAAVVVLAVVGCSSKVWVRPGTTQYQFSQDRSHCIEEAALPEAPAPEKGKEPRVDADAFAQCMEALGYEEVSEASMMLR